MLKWLMLESQKVCKAAAYGNDDTAGSVSRACSHAKHLTRSVPSFPKEDRAECRPHRMRSVAAIVMPSHTPQLLYFIQQIC